MNVTEYKVATISQTINTILTGLLVTGICWLILEVTGSRERWARMEERINTQSVHILELRNDISLWNQRREAQEGRLYKLEERVTVLESRGGPQGMTLLPADDRKK